MLRRALSLTLLSLGAALYGCASAPAPKLSFAELYGAGRASTPAPAAPGPASAAAAGAPASPALAPLRRALGPAAAPLAPRPAAAQPDVQVAAASLRTALQPAAPAPATASALPPLGLPVVVLRPVGPSPRRAASAAALSGPAPLVLDWPVEPVAVTSRFGRRPHPVTGAVRRHLGVDLAAEKGQLVSTAGRGRVLRAGWSGGYGLQVVVAHPGGLRTRYGHLSRVLVEPGTLLEPGDVVGLVGNTGVSTGPHLHFELWRAGRALDPLPVLAPRAAGLQTREGRRPSGRRPHSKPPAP